MQSIKRTAFLAILCNGWILATAVRGAEPPIHDGAAIFTPETLKAADGIVADIHRRFEMEIVIESFKEIPAEKKGQYSPDKSAEFFESWARERANNRKVRGIYMLICMNPRNAQVGIDRAASRRAFTPDNRRQLMEVMREKFKKSEFDAGLMLGLEFIRSTVADNLK